MFLRRAEGEPWPDLSDEALAADPGWLAPFLTGKTRLDEIGADDLAKALGARLPWDLARRLDDEAPTHFRAPTGTQAPIDYEAEGGPAIALRVQELFGLKEHPSLAGGRIPLTLELLSPAHRPIQITRDLPGFWRGSWAAVSAPTSAAAIPATSGPRTPPLPRRRRGRSRGGREGEAQWTKDDYAASNDNFRPSDLATRRSVVRRGSPFWLKER